MRGQRTYPDEDGHVNLAPGDFLFDPRSGIWYCRAPVADKHFIGNLKAHSVVEHEDGTMWGVWRTA